MSYYILAFLKFKNFYERTSRKTFIWFLAIHILMIVFVIFIATLIEIPFLVLLYMILSLLPLFAIVARRFIDIGKSPWWCITVASPLAVVILPALCIIPSRRLNDG